MCTVSVSKLLILIRDDFFAGNLDFIMHPIEKRGGAATMGTPKGTILDGTPMAPPKGKAPVVTRAPLGGLLLVFKPGGLGRLGKLTGE